MMFYYQSSPPKAIEEVIAKLRRGVVYKRAADFNEPGPKMAPVKPTAVSVPTQIPMPDFTGGEFDVSVADITDPGNFYLVYESAQHQKEYEALKTKMTRCYQYVSDELPPRLLEFYAAPIPHTDHWGRIKLLSQFDSSSLCFFIDEGFTATVSTNQLRHLFDPFKKLPPRSFKAYLENVDPPTNFWLEEHIELFKTLVLDKKLLAFVNVDKWGGYGCSLVLGDTNINELFFSLL